MAENPQDFTHPEPPRDVPRKVQRPEQQSSPLMNQLKNTWGLPWTRKPLSDKKGPTKGRSGPKSSRSGVHRLGKIPKQSSGWY